jgi:deoxyribodipyrimidine photo-lyase
VHVRHVHWRAGADWLVAHLLDGDLASNHLSWQWVAGTFSSKPYLFDAANVAHWAPPAWHSPGTAIDRPRDELERIALQDQGGFPWPPPEEPSRPPFPTLRFRSTR